MAEIEKIPLVLISLNDEYIETISRALVKFTDLKISQYSTNINDLEMIFSEKKPSIVLVGPYIDLEDLEKILQKYEYELRMIMVVVLVKKVTGEILKKALKLGVADVLQFPFEYDELKHSIFKAEKILGMLTGQMDKNKVIEQKTEERNCKKIMVFSTKGGAGKSFLATNLAVILKKLSNKDVVLYDLHYDYGDASLLLDIHPKQTIFDLALIRDNFSPEFLENFLIMHPSGIKALPAPIDPAQAELIDLPTTLKVFGALVKNFDYLVIDSPSRFSEEVLAILKRIDHLVLIATADIASIKNLKVSLKLLDQLKFPKEKIITVMNRANTKVGIDTKEIEETIGRKIDILIPSSIIVPVSTNKGKLVVESYPRSPITTNINKLAKMIL